jgi:hypothetical protein
VNHLGRASEPSVEHSRLPAVHSCPPSAPCMSSAVRTASLATSDLRAELERRRSGEDDCITIEHQWERRCFQGHNLNRDFDVVDTAPVGQAARTPMPPVGPGGGCMVLVTNLHMVVWLCKFWPHLSKKYDGSFNPVEFLQIYSTSILIAGGNEATMAIYFPVALIGTTRSWLMSLPEGSLTSWAELCY